MKSNIENLSLATPKITGFHIIAITTIICLFTAVIALIFSFIIYKIHKSKDIKENNFKNHYKNSHIKHPHTLLKKCMSCRKQSRINDELKLLIEILKTIKHYHPRIQEFYAKTKNSCKFVEISTDNPIYTLLIENINNNTRSSFLETLINKISKNKTKYEQFHINSPWIRQSFLIVHYLAKWLSTLLNNDSINNNDIKIIYNQIVMRFASLKNLHKLFYYQQKSLLQIHNISKNFETTMQNIRCFIEKAKEKNIIKDYIKETLKAAVNSIEDSLLLIIKTTTHINSDIYKITYDFLNLLILSILIEINTKNINENNKNIEISKILTYQYSLSQKQFKRFRLPSFHYTKEEFDEHPVLNKKNSSIFCTENNIDDPNTNPMETEDKIFKSKDLVKELAKNYQLDDRSEANISSFIDKTFQKIGIDILQDRLLSSVISKLIQNINYKLITPEIELPDPNRNIKSTIPYTLIDIPSAITSTITSMAKESTYCEIISSKRKNTSTTNLI